MKSKKPIVIDLCKIGWCAWIAFSIFLLFCLISEESAVLTWNEKDEIRKGNFVPINGGREMQWDEKATMTIENYCYQGILDSKKQCQSNYDYMISEFIFGCYVFAIVNGINGYLWFVALNRKYGSYEFKFKTCGDKK